MGDAFWGVSLMPHTISGRTVRADRRVLLTLCNDRPDTCVPGPQVEAPISHLTALTGGGSPVRRRPSFRTDDGVALCAPRLTATVLRFSLEPRLCPVRGIFHAPARLVSVI
ncbi:hypothetical protein GCM10017667_64170 [Streptomyces filamentosus]|uniref:Uncharacterized protein n=1 Tax=Streptomyces filamentosus TaxID=67294 RepID=A0A919EQT6_STRFL|nr:hypothetical protein GCM10017667_64170 [Streptomyces filamentosus]